MEGWWGKAVGGCVRLLSTTLNMIQNVSLPPALPGWSTILTTKHISLTSSHPLGYG